MSVCVTIRTKNILEPDVILQHLAEQGEKIVVTSNEYPSMKFGNHYDAIRGIEVYKEENGLEVRICSFSSKADYQLFAKTIDALMVLTKSKAYLEDETDEEIINPFSTFDDDWIEQEQKAGLDVARALITHSGHHIVMDGLFCKFCLGVKFFEDFDIPMSDDIDKEVKDQFFDYLCSMQWHCANLKDTSTHMVLPSPDGDPEKGLTLSIICIKDGKVNDFDYISVADLLGIIDMDDDSISPVFVPFREIWKILPNKIFEPLDELQYKRTEDMNVDIVHEMMDNARHLQPEVLHQSVTYPGEGFDENQNTFILMWNPDISSVTLDDHRYGIAHLLTEYFNWSVWDYGKAKCGDRFFLVRVGKGNTGIVMSGVFDSHPYEAGDWSGKGRRVFYMDMIPNVILDPEKAPMVTTEKLQKIIPSFDWSGGHSGRLLAKEDAIKLESMWSEYLAEHSENADGITLNVINSIN